MIERCTLRISTVWLYVLPKLTYEACTTGEAQKGPLVGHE
jgi:hypothetical protein